MTKPMELAKKFLAASKEKRDKFAEEIKAMFKDKPPYTVEELLNPPYDFSPYFNWYVKEENDQKLD